MEDEEVGPLAAHILRPHFSAQDLLHNGQRLLRQQMAIGLSQFGRSDGRVSQIGDFRPAVAELGVEKPADIQS